MLKGVAQRPGVAAPRLTEALRSIRRRAGYQWRFLPFKAPPCWSVDLRPLGNQEWRTDTSGRSLPASGAAHSKPAKQAYPVLQAEPPGTRDNGALPVPIRPEQFARLCRSLDLGAKYQAHVNAIFNPPANDMKPPHKPARECSRTSGSKRHDLAVAAHVASFAGKYPSGFTRWCSRSPKLNSDVALTDIAVHHKRMSMLDQPLLTSWYSRHGRPQVPSISFSNDNTGSAKLVAYIPDDPASPLKEFTTPGRLRKLFARTSWAG